MTGSWEGRGNQYIQLVKVLYCKLPTNRQQLPAFRLEVGPATEPQYQRWEVRMLPLCHIGPYERFIILPNQMYCYKVLKDIKVFMNIKTKYTPNKISKTIF